MEMRDAGVLVGIVMALYSVVSAYFNGRRTKLLRENHIEHLTAEFKDFKVTMWKRFDELSSETRTQGERISRIEGKLFNGGK